MAESLPQFLAAIVMLAVAVFLVFGYRAYIQSSSERRMRAMLEAMGVDPVITADRSARMMMAEVRDRCQHCPSEAVCERWLQHPDRGGNEFCPNQPVFEFLQRIDGAAA